MPDEESAAADFQERLTALHLLLDEAQALGFLGPRPVEVQFDHACAFAEAVEGVWGKVTARASSSQPAPRSLLPRAVVDLGAGGGVPGLLMAVRWTASSFLFVEVQARRAAFLLRAVDELGLGQHVTVEAERAEILGRAPVLRGAFDLVTARGFGRPAVTAECASPFLRVGGLLVVSEPPPDAPGEAGRWSVEGLAKLGMGNAQPLGSDYRFVAVPQEQPCPVRFPRRVGVPAKRPLF